LIFPLGDENCNVAILKKKLMTSKNELQLAKKNFAEVHVTHEKLLKRFKLLEGNCRKYDIPLA